MFERIEFGVATLIVVMMGLALWFSASSTDEARRIAEKLVGSSYSIAAQYEVRPQENRFDGVDLYQVRTHLAPIFDNAVKGGVLDLGWNATAKLDTSSRDGSAGSSALRWTISGYPEKHCRDVLELMLNHSQAVQYEGRIVGGKSSEESLATAGQQEICASNQTGSGFSVLFW